MVNLDRLRASGLTQEKLKSALTDPKKGTPQYKLTQEICEEIRDGVSRNLRDYRIYWAIDRAFDTPFYQLSYTKLRGLLSKTSDDKAVLEQVKNWGLVHMLPNKIDEKGCVCKDSHGQPIKSLNLPVFFDIEIPLVLAYVTIRWAKLFNDRNLVPFYKYEPVKFNKKNRARAEVITDLIHRMSMQYDYPADECQAILQTLMYGICLKFPREAWHTEKQEDENGKAKIVREGLRFNMPHPSRTYYDLFARTSTVNSNSGVRYGGYWEALRYQEVKDNPDYWNKDKITFGAVSWFNGFSDFFSTVYPCVLKWPSVNSDTITVPPATGALDRETEAAYYSDGEVNNATLVNQHFKLIVPKKYGLGTYEYPTWLRFVVGNGETIHWSEPTGYTPMSYYGYDADQNRARHSSLALEIIPFQDAVSQHTSQWRHSVKQNLMNPIFVNTDVVPQEIINQLDNIGDKLVSGKLFIPFSETENIRTSTSLKEAFVAPQLTRHDTSQLATLVRGILDILDRVLVLSSQEIAQAASHEQTAEEIKTIQGTTSTRLDFTGSFIDRGIFATKRMLYEAWWNHADDNVQAQISGDYASTEAEFKKMLKDIGLELDDNDDDGESKTTIKRSVKGKKKALALEIFSSTRDAANRIDNAGVAAAMSQIFTAVANNEALITALGAEQLVSLLNQIIKVAGLPSEFVLKPVAGADEQTQKRMIQEQLLEFAEQVKKSIDNASQQTAQVIMDEVSKSLQPLSGAIQQMAQKNIEQDHILTEVTQGVQQLNEVVAGIVRAAQQPPPPPPPQYDQSLEGIPIGLS